MKPTSTLTASSDQSTNEQTRSAAEWLRRWDRQQEAYMANREERFDVVLDVISSARSDELVVLDLGCGPGSLAVRILDRFPKARVVALDNDPVLILLGRRAYGTYEGRLAWITADLGERTWVNKVTALAPFDAVAATTALHWLTSSSLAAVYQGAGSLLRSGGILVNGDHFFEAGQPNLAALQERLRRLPKDDQELWDAWWESLRSSSEGDRELADAFTARESRLADVAEYRRTGLTKPDLTSHGVHLRDAGFAEVGTVWQFGDDRVLVGVRR